MYFLLTRAAFKFPKLIFLLLVFVLPCFMFRCLRSMHLSLNTLNLHIVNYSIFCQEERIFFFPAEHFGHFGFFSVNIETARNSNPSLAQDACLQIRLMGNSVILDLFPGNVLMKRRFLLIQCHLLITRRVYYNCMCAYLGSVYCRQYEDTCLRIFIVNSPEFKKNMFSLERGLFLLNHTI